MTTYHTHSVNLSEGQKHSLAQAFNKREAVTIRLSHNQLHGSDQLMLTKTQINRINKAKSQGKGTDLKISKAQIRHVAKKGGSLITTLMGLATKMLPIASKILPGLATGALSSLGNFGMDKVLGKGLTHTGGFLIPQNKIEQLIKYKSLLTKKQKEQILNSLQSGGQLIIKPTKTQNGKGLGTIIASIGLPIVIDALGKLFTGKGLQVDNQPGRSISVYLPPKSKGGRMFPYQPPPFIGSWKNPTGMGAKKKISRKGKKSKKGKGILLGKNSPLKDIPILGAIF